MFQIIKFCGITAKEVLALDQLLASEAVFSEGKYYVTNSDGHWITGRVRWAEKKRVSSEGATYVYEVLIKLITRVSMVDNTKLSRPEEFAHLYCPKGVIDAIHGAVHLLRDKEFAVPYPYDPDRL